MNADSGARRMGFKFQLYSFPSLCSGYAHLESRDGDSIPMSKSSVNVMFPSTNTSGSYSMQPLYYDLGMQC